MEFKYMEMAFKEAEKAFRADEVPIGAVIVKNGKILAKTHNTKEKTGCVVNHAEILALKKASKRLKNWRLDECDVYVTLEPCPMCASALKQARVANIYAALANKDRNNEKIIQLIFKSDSINPSTNFINNVCPDKSEILLQEFFSNKRKK